MPTVLVVDDDNDLRDALSQILEQHDYVVITAENGRAALDQLRHAPRPDVILLDLMMPVMDGVAFRKAQLEDAGVKDIPVILLSAARNTTRQVEMIRPSAWLQKPVKFDRLIDAL